MEMAERIKERRLAMGYTQEELAEKLGLQKSAIAKYENGRVENIKRSIISKMAEILECSPAYLMGWIDETENPRSSYIDDRDIDYLMALGEKLGYQIGRIVGVLGDSFVVTKRNEEHDVLLMNHEIKEMLESITQSECDIFTNTIDEKYNNKDYYVQPSEEELLEKIFINPITTIQEAKAYLSTVGITMAAFGGKITDEALIEIANVIRLNKQNE